MEFLRLQVLGHVNLSSLGPGLEVAWFMVAMDHGPDSKVALLMATMVAMDLVQLINGSTYPGSHTLDLMFASG